MSERATTTTEFQKLLKPFAIVLCVAFLAKGQALINPVPSVDAWHSMPTWSKPPMTLLLGQQRFGQYALFWILSEFGFRTIAVAFSSVAIALLLSVYSAVLGLRIIHPSDNVGLPLVISASIISIHPNFAEIFTFSDITFDVALSILLVVTGLSLIFGNRLSFKIAGILLIAFSTSIYQITLNIIAIILSLKFAFEIANRKNFKPTIVAAIISLCGVVFYLLFSSVLSSLLSIRPDPRSSLLSADQVSERFGMFAGAMELAFLPFWVPIATSITALVAVGFAAAAIIYASISRTYIVRPIVVAGALSVAALCAFGVAALGATIWIVPRVLIGAGVVIGGIVYSGLNVNTNRYMRVAIMAPALLALVGYIAINNTVFYEHQQLVSWDRSLAERVVNRLEHLPGAFEVETVVFHGDVPHRPQLRTRIGDLQLSATRPTWSQTELVEQSTGFKLARNSTTEEREMVASRCAGKGAFWPSNESVFIVGAVAGVCLSP